MAYIEVEVELDSFDLDEILEELNDRLNSYKNKKENREKIKQFFIDSEILEQNNSASFSLVDKMKIDFLMRNLSNIALNDLEKII